MRIRYAALLAALLLTTAAQAASVFDHTIKADGLAQVIAPAAQELKRAPVMRGRFVQKKFLSGIAQALQSSGSFIVAREQGIYWHTQQPFDSEFILTPTRMVQLDGGATAVSLSTEQQPGLRVVGDVFFSIFNLDPTALAANFSLFAQRSGASRWTMGLRPSNATLAQVISEAVINGGTRVEKVTLRDAHGDRTEIVLSASKVRGALTPAETALFKR